MYSLVYRSVAKDGFGIADIYVMLSKAKDFNAKKNITGCLLYHNNHFLQLLEGEKEVVLNLYEKIIADKRHHEVVLISSENQENRIFSEWSMAFHDYGQNGQSANLKSNQIVDILNKADAFRHRNTAVLKFFSSIKEILFTK